MNVTIKRLEKSWGFHLRAEGIVLSSYHENDKCWRSEDERPYYSRLNRPSSVPDDVIDEVVQRWKKLFGKPKLYIGWIREYSEYKKP